MNYRHMTIGALAVVALAAIAWYSFVPGTPAQKSVSTEVVELKNGDTYHLTASYVTKKLDGVDHKMLAYNGSIPGPLIKVEQGAEVTIEFRNDTGMKTLLHSHGVRMDNPFDGSQTTQKEMEPGETYSYKLKFPDEGLYWYHPHVRDDYQQEMGLYGAYLVVPRDKNYWSLVNREIAFFLDDIHIEDRRITVRPERTDRTLMGRFGNTFLINGETDYVLEAKEGEVLRLYLTNAANARPFNFAIEGVKMKRVGGDSGAYENAEWVDSVLLSPSERAIVEILVTKNTTMVNKTPEGTAMLGTIRVDGSDEAAPPYAAEFNILRSNTATIASIDPFRQYFNKAPDKRLTLTMDMSMGGGGGHASHMMPDGSMMNNSEMSRMSMGVPAGGIEWEDDMQMMNEMSTPESVKWHIVDQDTGKQDMDIDWSLERGKPVKIRIFNNPNQMHPMQHPIHFHGQRFLVVARDGVPQRNLVWKDTVFIRAGETVDIILDPSNPGTWMAHCHILEHIEAGMMFAYTVR